MRSRNARRRPTPQITRSVQPERLESRRLMSAGGPVGGDLWSAAATAAPGATVAIDATPRGHAGRLLAELRAVGLTGGARFDGLVSGYLPAASVARLPALPALKFAHGDGQVSAPTGLPLVNSAGVTPDGTSTPALNQDGATALGSDDVRAVFATQGANVKVGIISGSFNATGGYAADVKAGLLPSNETVLADDDTKGEDDEGRAMSEVVHDMAPSAQLYFSAAGAGQANMAQSILNLQKAGCRVIVDDVLFPTEPFFEDGVIARAVNTVQAQGVTYFSSAGNYGTNAYQAPWHAGTTIKVGSTALAGVAQNFAPSGQAVYGDAITLPQGAAATFVLQWDANYASLNPATGGAKNQLNLYLVDATGTRVVASATTGTIGKDPIQTLSYTNPSSTSDTFQVVITLAAGPAPTTVKYVVNGHTGDDAGSIQIDQYNSGGSIDPHAAAAGSIAVAAVEYDTTPNDTGSSVLPTVEPFSSQGSDTLVFNDTGVRLAKPLSRGIQITSVDGVDVDANKAPGFDGQFFGTSCAAPNAAALAALMLSAFPKATPAQILTALQSTALSLSPYSTAAAAGPGLIQAYQATLALSADFPAPAATASISGVVLDEPDLGTVGDYPAGGPIYGDPITLSVLTSKSTVVPAAADYTTGVNGTFAFKNLKPGIYLVSQAVNGQVSTDYPVVGSYQVDLAAGQAAGGYVFGDYLFNG